ncbi:hypothetical protein ALC62_04963 [Cyphomyrmex costatus]|uniref:Uncharacterized protein n=1 Tax=Cyphomyrmex costatus TaxID=456900 RepID=A0A195CU36_9HYME|nr:hypothetical protein ALC62_04963 [Cyphomyrmex costatus]
MRHSQCKHLRIDARFREKIVHVRAAGCVTYTRHPDGTLYVSSKTATWKCSHPCREAHLTGVDLLRAQDTSRNNHRRGTMFILRILVEARSIKRPSCR